MEAGPCIRERGSILLPYFFLQYLLQATFQPSFSIANIDAEFLLKYSKYHYIIYIIFRIFWNIDNFGILIMIIYYQQKYCLESSQYFYKGGISKPYPIDQNLNLLLFKC